MTKGFFPGLCNLFLLLHPFQKSPAEPGFTEVARIGQTDRLKLTALQYISNNFGIFLNSFLVLLKALESSLALSPKNT